MPFQSPFVPKRLCQPSQGFPCWSVDATSSWLWIGLPLPGVNELRPIGEYQTIPLTLVWPQMASYKHPLNSLSIQCKSSKAKNQWLHLRTFGERSRLIASIILSFFASGLMKIRSIPLSFTDRSSRKIWESRSFIDSNYLQPSFDLFPDFLILFSLLYIEVLTSKYLSLGDRLTPLL